MLKIGGILLACILVAVPSLVALKIHSENECVKNLLLHIVESDSNILTEGQTARALLKACFKVPKAP